MAGSIYVLFPPGYTTVEAYYPRESDLSFLERLALSVGLSLATVSLMKLALNYSAGGIRLVPKRAALSMYVVVVGFTAAYRKYSMMRKTYIGTQAVIIGALPAMNDSSELNNVPVLIPVLEEEG